MSKIPQQVYKLKDNIVFILTMAVWVMLFATLYTPTFGNIPTGDHYQYTDRAVRLWYAQSSFCIPILSAILVVVQIFSRLLLWGITRTNRISELEYFVWQLAEMIVACLFFDLFLSLFFSVSYFHLLPDVLIMAFLVLFIPYLVFWIYAEKKDRDERLVEANRTIAELKMGIDRAASESSAIQFVDEKGNAKLIVSPALVYTIEAAGNYVTILYENNGRLTRFALRNTLKGIEGLCEVNGLVRCHRSWFVNVRKIRLLRHDSEGIFAEIDGEGIPDIPVSKNYSASVIQRLSAN